MLGGFQDHPDQIPVIVGDVFRGFDTQITGVSPVSRPEPGTNYNPAAQYPGYYAPTDYTAPPTGGYTVNPSVISGPIVARARVELWNVSDEPDASMTFPTRSVTAE